jgi:hypothetical protein
VRWPSLPYLPRNPLHFIDVHRHFQKGAILEYSLMATAGGAEGVSFPEAGNLIITVMMAMTKSRLFGFIFEKGSEVRG